VRLATAISSSKLGVNNILVINKICGFYQEENLKKKDTDI
jgi:hypothetical protein